MDKKKKKNGKNSFIDYDYELQFNNQIECIDQSFIQSMLEDGKKKFQYCTKVIKAGKQLEVEIYPLFTRKERDLIKDEAKKKKKDRAVQRNLNDKNARKYLERLINTNFNNQDKWVTLTYDDDHVPESMEEATKQIQNFFRRMNYRRKKRNLEKIKYIYVTEKQTKKEGVERYHHHLIMDGSVTMEQIMECWKNGGRNEYRSLEEDDAGFTGIACYITKEQKARTRRWSASTGLKEPEIERRFRRSQKKAAYSRKEIAEMVSDQNRVKEMMLKDFKEYKLVDQKIFFNDFNALFYISIRMKRKKGTKEWQRSLGGH